MIQHPVRYPVRSTSPVRIAGYDDAPFRIVNLTPMPASGSVKAIWVSDNAGLRAGFGTPIYAGTSLQWVKPTELFAVCEPGDTGCELLVTSEIDDWKGDPLALATATAIAIINTGIIVIDQPKVLLSNVQLDNFNAFSPVLDISRYSSVSVYIDVLATSGIGVDELQMSFMGDGFELIGKRGLRWYGANLQSYYGSFPVRGSRLQFAQVSNGSTFRLTCVLGSSRPLTRVEGSINGYTNNSVFAWENYNAALAASASMDVHIPPWFGELEAEIRVTSANPINSSEIQVSRWNPYTLTQMYTQGVIPSAGGANAYNGKLRWAVNGEATRCTFVNRTTGAVPAFLHVSAVSGNGVP